MHQHACQQFVPVISAGGIVPPLQQVTPMTPNCPPRPERCAEACHLSAFENAVCGWCPSIFGIVTTPEFQMTSRSFQRKITLI